MLKKYPSLVLTSFVLSSALSCSGTEEEPLKDCYCTVRFRLQDINIGGNALGYQTAVWNSADANLACYEALDYAAEITWSIFTYSGQQIDTRTENYTITASDIEAATCNE
ncbi:MAG: hypothetical protein ACON42_04310 [Flavobacteriaceae bacterium]